jgi:hypothetical protein
MAQGSSTAQGIITTLAGNQIQCSYGGDGGPAASALLCNAMSQLTDSAGNIYFPANSRIRKIAPDGTITTIAGNGVPGTSGDGGPALAASLGGINQMAMFGTRICFGDNAAYKVRCVDVSNGMIYGYGTGASGTSGDGGSISSASFMSFWGVVFDDKGNFYIADPLASSVRKVDPSGTITMFVGPGPGATGLPLGDGGPALGANIYQPDGLAYWNGGLYIADTGNRRIRRVDLGTGIITTVAGNGTVSPGTEGGLAILAGIVPRWITTDPTGNLFLTDSGGTIRMVDTAGNMTTVAGASGNSGVGRDDIPATLTVFSGIYGLGWDPVAQRLLISDGTNRIRQIFYSPGTTTTLTTSNNPAHWNQTVTLQATVSPVDAVGNVRFYLTYPAQVSQGIWSYLGTAPLVNGTATFSWTAPVGDATYALSAVYGGDPTHNLSMAPAVTQVVQSGSSSTSLTSSPNPSVAGQSITFTATITPSDATGTVTFLNSGSSIGSALVSGGTATFSTSGLPAGSNSITASYGGDSRYAASTSSVLIQTVKASTTTALSASPSTSAYGDTVTLTATVTPSAATGSVQFFNGTTSLGTANLTNGQAQLVLTSLPSGTASLTATYSGDANNTGSTSAAIAETVNPRASSITLTSSANPANLGQTVTFTATVSPAQATGSIQFLDSGVVLGTVAVANGTATLTTSTLTAGDHPIGAAYLGDANTTGSTVVLVETINKQSTSIAVTAAPNPAVAGQTVTFTAVVTPSNVTGLVQFFEGTGILGTVQVSGGTASLTLSAQDYTFAPGTHTIKVNYNGDPNSALSSTTVTLTVKSNSTTTLTSSVNPATPGQAVTFTATVSPAQATGVIQFNADNNALGTVAIVNGTATISVSTLTTGDHVIGAAYLGDANTNSSTSTLIQTITKQPTSVVLTTAPNPANVGQTVTFTAAVTPSNVTGLVQFFEGTGILGTIPVSGGTATLTLSAQDYAFASGTHTIKVNYNGDANFALSTTTTTLVVKSNSTTTLTSSANPAAPGQAVTFTATVSPAQATGSIQFNADGVVLGTVTIVNGTATVPVSTLTTGNHVIGAAYLGDANTNSSSTTLIQTITKQPTSVVLTATPNPAIVGQTVTFTAVVTPSSATGLVQIFEGSGILGTIPVSGGVAMLTLSPQDYAFAAGIHTIKVNYNGDANSAASTSTMTLAVAQANSATTLISTPPSPTTVGQTVTFTATVSPASATGTVQFVDGGTVIGSAPVAGGAAVFSTAALASGNHSITAAYSGDANYKASISPAVTRTVNKISTSVSLATNPNPSTFASMVTLTATVSPAQATGTATFFTGQTALGTATVTNGIAQLSIATLPAGANSLTATYSGDAAYSGSTSAAATQTVHKANSTTTLTASPDGEAAPGQTVTFTATVMPALATGTVQFLDGKLALGTAKATNGVAVFSTSTLWNGGHSITAVYRGDGNVNPSQSDPLSYRIRH